MPCLVLQGESSEYIHLLGYTKDVIKDGIIEKEVYLCHVTPECHA